MLGLSVAAKEFPHKGSVAAMINANCFSHFIVFIPLFNRCLEGSLVP
jgi:hypothetical protein